MLIVEETERILPTHLLTPAGPLPTCLDPDGCYPYESYVETSRRPILKTYRFVRLENNHLAVEICPDLGGKVYSLYLKKEGVHCLYDNPIVRPVRILPRGFFIGGGIEVSFPISHSPVSSAPVLYETSRVGERAYVSCGERELRFGMRWTVEYSLGEDDRFLTQRSIFVNDTARPHPWMSWSNAAAPSAPDTEFHFPSGPVLRHGDTLEEIDWQTEGFRTQAEVDRMYGLFWRSPQSGVFGVYTPSLGSGLYHVADLTVMPGIKLWTDGIGRHEEWVNQYTCDGRQCLEIQAGPLVDQSEKGILQPGDQHRQVEYWLPTARRLDLAEVTLPSPHLRPVEAIPLFAEARPQETAVWTQLTAWHAGKTTAPTPPGTCDNCWPPSGFDELEKPLTRICDDPGITDAHRHRWRFLLGCYHCGRGEHEQALAALKRSQDPRARCLAARIHTVIHNNLPAALAEFATLRDEALLRHPQVVVEYDRLLAATGDLKKRAELLASVSALEDEWLRERQADLLLQQDNPDAARNLLNTTPFQLVHQRYARTRLWKDLHDHNSSIPSHLGEDDLAQFGAYREFADPSS